MPILADWGEMSRAARDAAYNNTAAFAGRAYVDALRVDSHRLRAERPDHLNMPFGLSEREAWDLFPGPAGSDCLVFIHGGYWQRNDRQGAAAVVEGALAAGWSAALPGYTLAPDATLSEIVRQIRAGLDWLVENGKRYGITGRIVLSGWSAGGHLAAMALDHPGVAAVLSISGIHELGPLRDTDLNVKLALTEEEVETLSPLRLPCPDKPMTLAYGSRELQALVVNSCSMHARRAALHLPGALIPVAGAGHFTVLDQLRRPDGVLLRAARDLLG